MSRRLSGTRHEAPLALDDAEAGAASVVVLWAEQKLVPELPIRQLSRTLSGVAAYDDIALAARAAEVNVAISFEPI